MSRPLAIRLLFVLLGALLMACTETSSVPSEADARRAFEQRIHKVIQSGEVQIVGFKKTNGKQTTVMGMNVYEVSYEATLEALKAATCPPGYQYSPCTPKKKGERQTVKSEMYFERTENGWSVVK